MTPQVLTDCLLRAGATVEGESAPFPKSEITKLDMFYAGLSGGPGSSEKRKTLMKILDLPEHMSSNALLQALNLLISKEEFYRLTDTL